MERDLKKNIQNLIDDFKSNYQQYKTEREANIETKLIEPLFKLLGWTKNDFIKQEKAHRGSKKGWVDYSFHIDGKIAFFLEVKRLGVALDKEADKQVISYALSKRIPFAISTNFEQLKIFCVEQENAINNVFRVFRQPEEYITSLHDLVFLSKESFEKNLIQKKAEAEGRLKKRISIDKPLLDDLMRIRSMIANDIEKSYSKKYEVSEKDEIVQRIIDRLIFIRKCEDVNINPIDFILKEIQELPDNKAYLRLKALFKTYNDTFNSGLFAIAKDNDCDKIKIDGSIIKKLVGYLYKSKDGKYVYNFDWIDADVLGQVYEQYLGKILAQTKSGKTKLKEGISKRKEQGIYYTPTYIVDYIIKNTIGEALKSKKVDATKLKILDPACGSGSFLIKAFDYLNGHLSEKRDTKQRKLDSRGMYSIKTEILKNNLFGVDLDNKAVEITKLNLLLKAAEKDRKLPEELDDHVQHGNSLIDDESVTDFAFKWEDDFDENSFDVVIGNPPYIKIQNIPEKEREYFVKHKNASGKFDIYLMFIKKSIALTKKNGYISFITPSNYLKAQYGKEIRNSLSKHTSINIFIDFGDLRVFSEVTTYPSIIVFQNNVPKKDHRLRYVRIKSLDQSSISKLHYAMTKDFDDQDIESFSVLQSTLSDQAWSLQNPLSASIIEKIKSRTDVTLGKIRERIFTGVQTSADKEYVINSKDSRMQSIDKGILKPYLFGKDVRRWITKFRNNYVIYPHKKVGDRVVAISEKEMKGKYSNTWKYLNQEKRKSKLLSRDYLIKEIKSGKREEWYEVWCQRDPDWFDAPKILTPALSDKPNFTYDDKGYYFVSGSAGVYGIMLKPEYANKEFYKYLLGILNSKITDFFIKSISPMFSGGYYKYNTQYLEPLPIVIPKKEVIKDIVKLVGKMLSLHKRINAFGDKQTSERKRLEKERDKTDAEIDKLVYKLYGLNQKEIKVVEENLK